uniref:AXH domain-containing protein n=1 Tax=Parastrongyloides trichosuri TaxID=131310 RepID=A0A0N5A1I5_PARTI
MNNGEIEILQNVLQSTSSSNNGILEQLTSPQLSLSQQQQFSFDISNILSNNGYQNLFKILNKNSSNNILNQSLQQPSSSSSSSTSTITTTNNSINNNSPGQFKVPSLPHHMQHNENNIMEQQKMIQQKLLIQQLQQVSQVQGMNAFKNGCNNNNIPTNPNALLEQHMILMNAINNKSSVDTNPFTNPTTPTSSGMGGVNNSIGGKNPSLEQLERLSQTGTSSLVKNCFQMVENNNNEIHRNIFTFNQQNDRCNNNSNAMLQQIVNNNYQEKNFNRERNNNIDDKIEKIDKEPLKGELTALPYYPTHYMRGTQIQLFDGTSKPVNKMVLEDFKNSLANFKEVELTYAIVLTIKQVEIPGTNGQYRLSFKMVGSNCNVSVNAVSEFPFFEQTSGWSSCNPNRSLSVYGLECRKLQIGDVCLIATPKATPNSSPTNNIPLNPNVLINNNNNIFKTSLNPFLMGMDRKIVGSNNSLTSSQVTGTSTLSMQGLDQLLQQQQQQASNSNVPSIFPKETIPYNITSLLSQVPQPFPFRYPGQISCQLPHNMIQNQNSELHQPIPTHHHIHPPQSNISNNNCNDGSSMIKKRKTSNDV